MSTNKNYYKRGYSDGLKTLSLKKLTQDQLKAEVQKLKPFFDSNVNIDSPFPDKLGLVITAIEKIQADTGNDNDYPTHELKYSLGQIASYLRMAKYTLHKSKNQSTLEESNDVRDVKEYLGKAKELLGRISQ